MPGEHQGEDLVQKVIAELIEIGILRHDDNIVVKGTLHLKYAYIIYTHTYQDDIKIISEFLKEHRIYPAGRFADWEYMNMDRAIIRGSEVADEISH